MTALAVNQDYFFKDLDREVSDKLYEYFKNDPKAEFKLDTDQDVSILESSVTSILRQGIGQVHSAEEFHERLIND